MKHLKFRRLFGLVLTGCLSILYAQNASAVAGDTIANLATLTFDVGGTATTLESSAAGNTTTGVGNGASTDFIEDLVINFTVAEVGGLTTLVAPSATLQVQTFTVTNNGNAAGQDFLLAAINAASTTVDPNGGNADSFNVTAQVFVENGTTAGYQSAGVDQDTGVYIDELAPLGVATVYIVSTIPAVTLPLVNADVAVMTLVVQNAAGGAAAVQGPALMNDSNGNASKAGTYSNGATTTVAAVVAATADNPAGMDVVFNDPAGATAADVDSAGTVQDIARNGQHSDSDSYTVGAPLLTVTKTLSTLWDPVNANSNPKAIPGAYVRYTISITNDAAAGASGMLTSMSDTLSDGSLPASPGINAIDPNYTDGSAVAGATVAQLLATATFGAGIAFDVAHTGVGNTRADPVNCTTTVGDGCAATTVDGGVISIDFVTLMPAEDIAPAGAGVEDYLAGELKIGETVTFMFNVIVR